MAEHNGEVVTDVRAKLNAHTPVEIVVMSESGQHFYSSILVDFDDDSFFLLPPRKDKTEIHLKDGEIIKVIYPASDALYQFDSKVIGFRLDQYGGREFQCVIPRKGMRFQRREFYRLPMTLNATYHKVLVDKVAGVKKYSAMGENKPCMIDNISGGGVSVFMNTQFSLGDLFEIEFTLELETRPKTFKQVIKVARDKSPKHKPVHGAYEFCYGGSYEAIEETDRNEIVRFILKKQIELFGRGRK
ncbi:MAG: flagellar brake protein [Candidatus Omnitrophica bacterium]|nr:flagellar brake protein [Candidatus Omnitrophota bacterium]